MQHPIVTKELLQKNYEDSCAQSQADALQEVLRSLHGASVNARNYIVYIFGENKSIENNLQYLIGALKEKGMYYEEEKRVDGRYHKFSF